LLCQFADRTVKVWDLNTGEETLSCAGHKRDVVAVRYCPKTQRIFGASQNVIKVNITIEKQEINTSKRRKVFIVLLAKKLI